jgi:hypothetical protein
LEVDTTIEANVRKYDEPLSQDIIDSERFVKPKKNQDPTTWGEAVTNRINNQSGGFAKDNPNSTKATTGVQANFEEFIINSKGEKIKIRNGHLDISE